VTQEQKGKRVFNSVFCRARALIAGAALSVVLLGCTSTPSHPDDPLEPLNRAIFVFNDAIDTVLIKPVAQGYRAVLPTPVRTSVSNFFSNTREILDFLYYLLQGNVPDALDRFARFAINSTFGLGGLFDVAEEAGIPKKPTDFGLTMRSWGIGHGIYLEVPLIGPSSARDAVGLAVDAYADPLWRWQTSQGWVRARNVTTGVRYVNQRAKLLDAETVLDTAAIDKYAFRRDAYLQARGASMYRLPERSEGDGEPRSAAPDDALDPADLPAAAPRAAAEEPRAAVGALPSEL
jgi:phospholipid-binding lipoprotein MlaA